MEIIGRFLHLQKKAYRIDSREYYREELLFPRYHQLDVVRKLTSDAKAHGAGKKYLVQHSAGSGKSNSIAWLAYRLSSLFDSSDKKVFDSIIVITDRNVLDQQLQDTIYQFEHKQGVVLPVEDNAEQLAAAINSGISIIITTLQKFPFALKHLADNPGRNYAIIIDEAHSSQGGEASRKMTEALAGKNVTLEEAESIESRIEGETVDEEDVIRETISKRGPQKNISIFAFTATPKTKTLEVFGNADATGNPRPFHLYSMRQAIEEGFILDVLQNYTSYKEFYRFSKSIEDDPEINKRKASKAIGRFASLHPVSLAQKTEVMVEHFRQVTMKKIGGKAKAMVVTASRKHALHYYLEFKEYIKEREYDKGPNKITPLVAFSGSLVDEYCPEGITEAQLNGFGERELPEKFGTDEYQVLLVADKYQTAFDQPLLHTMYVDKKLSGVKAVQTLSRLNRTYPGKDDKTGYHIEHVISMNDENKTYFSNEEEFKIKRNKLGGLLLLYNMDNIISNNEEYYDGKRKTYYNGLIWGKTLIDTFYHKTNFRFKEFNKNFKQSTGVEFKPIEEFNAEALEYRSKLLFHIVKNIWEVD